MKCVCPKMEMRTVYYGAYGWDWSFQVGGDFGGGDFGVWVNYFGGNNGR